MGLKKGCDLIVFADEKLKKYYFKSLRLNSNLAKSLIKAKKDILENVFCGVQISKNLIPDKYIHKYGINNLWKYNLDSSWRLLYSITTPSEFEIIVVVLDWMNHKNYEKLFNY